MRDSLLLALFQGEDKGPPFAEKKGETGESRVVRPFLRVLFDGRGGGKTGRRKDD